MTEASEPKPFSAEDEAHFLRAHKLLRAWETSEFTTVDSVHFDLRCDVNKDLWRPLAPIGLYGRRAALYGPEFVFPWTPPFIREFMEKSGPVIEVGPGATIVTGPVITAQLKSPFADFQDEAQRDGKQVHLFVLHANGEAEMAQRPLTLLTSSATDALIVIEDYSGAFQGLVDHLEQLAGLEDLETLSTQPIDTWPKPRPGLPPGYSKALLALIKAYDSYDHEAFAVFGYLMAKAEVEGQLLDAAMRGRQAAGAQAKASDARRSGSREQTEKLRIIARDLIARDVDISLSRCAREVEAIVAIDPTWQFKSDAKWITRHIRELFEKRGGGREYRPRRVPAVGTTGG